MKGVYYKIPLSYLKNYSRRLKRQKIAL